MDDRERYMLDFADRLKSLRLQHGMTRRQMCQLACDPRQLIGEVDW